MPAWSLTRLGERVALAYPVHDTWQVFSLDNLRQVCFRGIDAECFQQDYVDLLLIHSCLLVVIHDIAMRRRKLVNALEKVLQTHKLVSHPEILEKVI